jgi:long-subunit acyl-CoA synthetase (AMP-forming)
LSLFPSTGVVDEWFSANDIGRVDDDGHFFLVARKSI